LDIRTATRTYDGGRGPPTPMRGGASARVGHTPPYPPHTLNNLIRRYREVEAKMPVK
jgi:hypothetical protein